MIIRFSSDYHVQGLLLLDCLKCYSRLSLPSEAEKIWYASHYLQPSNSTEVRNVTVESGGGGGEQGWTITWIL